MLRNIPNILTLCSLAIAVISIIESCAFNFVSSSYLIIICLFLDGVDGSIARYLNVQSNYGKQLDGLSDMVAFGVAPGLLMYQFIVYEFDSLFAFISILIPICTAIRIANYNINDAQINHFIGLTSPVSALFFVSIPLIIEYETYKIIHSFNKPVIISISIIIISLLLICRFNTFNMRIDSIKSGKRKLYFICFSISLLIIFKYVGLMFISISYIILSIMKIIK